jgi:biotin operon repressor
MPKGIVAVQWDDTKGTVIRGKYPEDLQVTADEMMRIFTSHAMGEGKPGFMTMKLEAMNVASYYTGLAARGEPQYYLAVIVDLSDDAGIYEEPLTEIGKELLNEVNSRNFQDHLVQGYNKIIAYTKLTDEQRLAQIILDPVRKLIFKKLTQGCITKIELQEWLEQETGTRITDMDLLLVPFIRTNIIRKGAVEGITGDCIFLIRDMFITFAPPEKIMTRIMKGEIKGDLAKAARSQIADFFKGYRVSEDDESTVANLLANFDTYGIVSQLRANLEGEEELAKELGKSKVEIEKTMRNLQKLEVVGELTDSTESKVYVLKSDPQISLFYPEYMIDIARTKWSTGEISKEMAVKYLQILREDFLS